LAHLLYAVAFAADQDPWLGRMDDDLNLARETFDLDPRNTSFGGFTVDQLADQDILLQLFAVFGAFGVSAALPGLVNVQTKTDGMDFSTHNSLLPFPQNYGDMR
jgi:hypothetical protein